MARHYQPKRADHLHAKIREVESRVLDKHHEGQRLLKRSELEAVTHLLKVYGDIVREFDSPELRFWSTDARLSNVERMTRGLDQSLRWALMHCPPGDSFSNNTRKQIDEEALTLLLWAQNYCELGMDHIAASRGFYRATCNEAARRIVFHATNTADFAMLTAQRAAWTLHTNDFLNNLPEAEIAWLFEEWRSKSEKPQLFSHGEVTSFYGFPPTRRFPQTSNWTRKHILPELHDQCDLDGFTLGQLRDFWAQILLECQLVSRLEDHTDKTYGLENNIGSLLYQGSKADLVDYFSHQTGLDASAITSIIDCLTFHPETPKSTTANSPFIRTQCGSLSLSCRRVTMIDPNIMIAAAMAKRTRSHIYNSLINKIEKHNVNAIATAMRKAGFIVLAQPRIRNQQGQSICPDLIFYDPATTQALIADYKHAIPPTGASEVANRLIDLDGWTAQILRYLAFSNMNSNQISEKLGGRRISRLNGMLLFRWPLAIPGLLQGEVTYGDWTSLSIAARLSKELRINDILNLFRTPRDAEQNIRHWQIGEEHIIVGDWTYTRPLVIAT